MRKFFYLLHGAALISGINLFLFTVAYTLVHIVSAAIFGKMFTFAEPFVAVALSGGAWGFYLSWKTLRRSLKNERVP